VIFQDGKFACAAHPADGEHRRRIFALAGMPDEHGPPDAARDRERRERYAREKARVEAQRKLSGAARASLRAILDRHRWSFAEVWEDSPQVPHPPALPGDPRQFLRSLYPSEALLWTGEVWHSGPDHAGHWKSCGEWCAMDDPAGIGPMVAPAVWKPGTVSRTADAVLRAPYTVLDFDGFGGIKPVTPEQKEAHLLDSLALIRWLRERLRWAPAAILWTGGKSLHAWFHTPPEKSLASLANAATELGIDAGLIGRPEHPCRLPGWRHEGTGECARVLWLDVP
jgi:hypothetical protein